MSEELSTIDRLDQTISRQLDTIGELRKIISELQSKNSELLRIIKDAEVKEREKFISETEMRIFCNRAGTKPTEAFDMAVEFWNEKVARMQRHGA